MKAEPTDKDIAPFDAEVIGTVSERKHYAFLDIIAAIRKRKFDKKLLIFVGKDK